MDKRPHAREGEELKKARGGRTLREVSGLLGVSISRLQNWERGDNAPKRELWPKFKAVLGVDVAALYGGADEPTGRYIKPQAILPLIEDMQKKLDLLRAMCSNGVSSHRVRKAGFSAKDKKQKENV